MLGRICMTLEPQDIISAATDDSKVKIKYITKKNFGLKYEPSFNIAPGELAPIAVSSKHFEYNEKFDYAIVPALWGLIPRWHKGDYREHGFNTANFRAENMNQSRMYKPAFSRGQRCVLICEGYYEHQRVPYRLPPNQRPIYFIYSHQMDGIEIDNRSTWNCHDINLLYIAGIFDIWRDNDGDEIVNFTILSVDSEDNIMSWLHPRTPVILESSEQIYEWLNFAEFSGEDVLKIIKPPKHLKWHRVSDYVLDITYKDNRCNKALESDDNED